MADINRKLYVSIGEFWPYYFTEDTPDPRSIWDEIEVTNEEYATINSAKTAVQNAQALLKEKINARPSEPWEQ